MYLKASKYLSGYDHQSDETKKAFNKVLRAAGVSRKSVSKNTPSLEVSFNIAYWRKSNSIHAWFVRECQNGVDECQTSYVSREKLTELRDLCALVVATKNHKLLEPQSGFFFGSTDIDQWYWDDLAHTVKNLTTILNAPALKGCDFYYRSSW